MQSKVRLGKPQQMRISRYPECSKCAHGFPSKRLSHRQVTARNASAPAPTMLQTASTRAAAFPQAVCGKYGMFRDVLARTDIRLRYPPSLAWVAGPADSGSTPARA